MPLFSSLVFGAKHRGGDGDVPLNGSHFHDWIDYNRGRIFSRVTRIGGTHFRIFWGKTVLHIYG